MASPLGVLGTALNLDSLWGVWNDSTQADTNRLKAADILAWQVYRRVQPDSAIYFAQLQYQLAASLENKKWMARGLFGQGILSAHKGFYSESIDYLLNSIRIYNEMGNNHRVGIILNDVGIFYYRKGDYANAILYLHKSLKLREKTDFKNSRSKAATIAQCFNNIGIIYYEQGNYEKALDYYQKCLNIYGEIKDRKGIAMVRGNIGTIYMNRNDFEKAMEYFKQSLDIYKAIGYQAGISDILYNIGDIYRIQGYQDTAMEYYTNSLKIQQKIGDKFGITNSLNKVGLVYLLQGDMTKAISHSTRALAIAKELNAANEIRDAASCLYKSYKAIGKRSKAFEMYELYITMRDSILSEENQREIIRQEYQYKYEKKAVADSTKNAETAKVKDAQLQAQQARIEKESVLRNGLIGGLVLTGIFLFLLYDRFKIIRLQKTIIQEKNTYITDSISYAKQIQDASLTSKQYMDNILDDYFVYFQPKDIVSGDFYWMHQLENGNVMIAVADCTGHGVPGGFMSMMGTGLLNEIIIDNGITQLNTVLDTMRTQLIKRLHQDESRVKAMDGMDISLVLINKETREIDFASAGHKIYVTDGKECKEIKGDSYPVGYYFGREKPFTKTKLQLNHNESIYLTTDGFTDQFGGKLRKKFGRPAFKKLLITMKDRPMSEQQAIIGQTLKDWKGNNEQIDDILVIGLGF